MIRILNQLSILAGIIISLLSSTASIATTLCTLPATRTHTVIGLTDTRTLKLDNAEELRLAAILAPTAYDSPAAPTIWPPETAARQALLARVLGRNIAVAPERSARDRYGRTIAQVLFGQSRGSADAQVEHRWLQAMMIRAGHARVALSPEIDAACARLLLAAEAKAEANQRGLWQLAVYQPRRAEDTRQLLRYRSTFQIVEGVVARVSVQRSAIYLNFGRNWKHDYSAKLSRVVLQRAGLDRATVLRLVKQPVRIRGWIEKRNGPLTTVWRPEQIELLDLTATGQSKRHDPPRLLSQAIADNRPADN